MTSFFLYFAVQEIFCGHMITGSVNTKWINTSMCGENGKDHQRVFDTESSALCPHL